MGRYWFCFFVGERYIAYHQQCPDGVVEENYAGGHEHGEADEFVELCGFVSFWESF
jgi:hypothetical protein